MGLQLLKAPKNATYLLMIIHRALHKFSCQLSRARHHLPLFLMVNNAAISSPILRSSPAEGACSCILWFFRNFRVHGGLGETVKPETEDLWHPPLGTAGKASLVTG